ncbi:MAG: hypothetical protein H7836_08030 [Magnetococcus sp. YQC-3]
MLTETQNKIFDLIETILNSYYFEPFTIKLKKDIIKIGLTGYLPHMLLNRKPMSYILLNGKPRNISMIVETITNDNLEDEIINILEEKLIGML